MSEMECENCQRLLRMLNQSTEWRRKAEGRNFELAEKVRGHTEKEATLDSEKAMNATLTIEVESLQKQLAEAKLLLKDIKPGLYWARSKCNENFTDAIEARELLTRIEAALTQPKE